MATKMQETAPGPGIVPPAVPYHLVQRNMDNVQMLKQLCVPVPLD